MRWSVHRNQITCEALWCACVWVHSHVYYVGGASAGLMGLVDASEMVDTVSSRHHPAHPSPHLSGACDCLSYDSGWGTQLAIAVVGRTVGAVLGC